MLRAWDILKDRLQGKARPGERRSSQWRKIRRVHLILHPRCAVCGGRKKLEVHHKLPFNIAPDKELSPMNLITLCERKKYGINCHLLIGHLGNYRDFNASVSADAAYWRLKLNKDPTIP